MQDNTQMNPSHDEDFFPPHEVAELQRDLLLLCPHLVPEPPVIPSHAARRHLPRAPVLTLVVAENGEPPSRTTPKKRYTVLLEPHPLCSGRWHSHVRVRKSDEDEPQFDND